MKLKELLTDESMMAMPPPGRALLIAQSSDGQEMIFCRADLRRPEILEKLCQNFAGLPEWEVTHIVASEDDLKEYSKRRAVWEENYKLALHPPAPASTRTSTHGGVHDPA